MKTYYYTSLLARFLALTILCGLSSPSTSSAISYLDSRDLLSPGDGLISYDPLSGLEWLDFRPTAGLSVNQTLQSRYIAELGFQYAAEGQVKEMLVHVLGSLKLDTSFVAEDMSPEALSLYHLYQMFGYSLPDPNHLNTGMRYYFSGAVAEPAIPINSDPNLTTRWYPEWFVDPYQSVAEGNGANALTFGPERNPRYIYVSDTGKSHFLVRHAVPDSFGGVWWIVTLMGLVAVRHRTALGILRSYVG